MPTIKQKKALAELVGNGGNVTQAMRNAGYTEATANTPQKLTESVGFQEALNEAGLTDEFLNACLFEDIEAKKQNRKAELELAYKLKHKLIDKAELTGKDGGPIEFKGISISFKSAKKSQT